VPGNGPLRFRCRVGHGFTARSLQTDQEEAIERTLWAAMRALEERAALLDKMAHHARQAGRNASAGDYERQAADSKTHSQMIRGWIGANVGHEDESD